MSRPNAFIPTGCTVLDRAMGNGYPLGRVTNIVGDKSTGKTLLAIEALANFHRLYPNGHMRYKEAESAFDVPYAESLGFPVDAVTIDDTGNTVEDLHETIVDMTSKCNGDPGILIVDSLDALTDKAEMGRKIGENSYGTSKAAQLSQMFRRTITPIANANLAVIIISQVRDNIGVTFGRKTKRSGGRALDFYASLVIYLAEIRKRVSVVNKVSRVTGVDILAKIDKNKIAAPFREAGTTITFGYGMENVESCIRYLESVKHEHVLRELGLPSKITQRDIKKVRDDPEFEAELIERVNEVWDDIETWFSTKRNKYR